MTEHDFDLLELVETSAMDCAGEAIQGRHAVIGYMEPQLARMYVGDARILREIFVILTRCVMQLESEQDICIRATNGNVYQDDSIGVVALRFAVHYTHAGLQPPRLNRAQQLIESLGGKLRFGRDKGKGCFLSFVLKLCAAVEQVQRPLYVDELRGVPLFVLSNEPPTNRAIHGNLRYWGLRCDGAPTFQEGILEITRQATLDDPYKIIIVSQPIEDGSALDVAQEVRSSALRNAKMIHIDRFEDESSRRASLEAGFDLYMSKPFRTCELLEAIGRLLGVSLLPSVGRTPPRVLIVEDNLTNQKLAMFQLRRLGITADLAPNGLEALRALARKQYELVLMDVAMPIMGGYETLRRIRAQSHLSTLPVVILTSEDDPMLRENLRSAGMSDFFSKPVDGGTMQRIIEKWCGNIWRTHYPDSNIA